MFHPRWAEGPQSVTVPCPPAAIIMPPGQSALKRAKGDSSIWIFRLAPQPNVRISVSRWLLNGQDPFSKGMTDAGWGLFGGGGQSTSLTWASPAKGGLFTVTVKFRRSCGGGGGVGGGPAPEEEELSWAGEVKTNAVVFDPALIKTGYTADGSKDIEKVVTATVDPKEDTGAIQFILAGPHPGRAKINSIVREKDGQNAFTGKVTIKIGGVSFTPITAEENETVIQATKDGVVKGEAAIIVVIPYAVGTPHEEFDGPVVGRNMVMTTKSVPPIPGLEEGQGYLVTSYATALTIVVIDQFGDQLDDLYQGVPVKETIFTLG